MKVRKIRQMSVSTQIHRNQDEFYIYIYICMCIYISLIEIGMNGNYSRVT